jgi:site-specific DNA-methyltransferase (adenine-specific)
MIILEIAECNSLNRVHPTQKPELLMEYLIKTYTNENETVLDFTMGSGTTGVACKNLNRKFIGIEMDDKYFEIAKKRIE